MKRIGTAWLIVVVMFSLLSGTCTATAAAAVKKAPQAKLAQVDPMTVTKKLGIKDDRGGDWILKNAKQYRLKWSYEDANPYQMFEGAVINGGRGLLVTSFDSATTFDLSGNVLWSTPVQIDINHTRIVGADGTVYFLNEGDGHAGLAGETAEGIQTLSGIERIDVQGNHASMPAVSVHRVTDQGGFDLGYPHAGDAGGNLLLLTTEGLVSYKPDGTVGWQSSRFDYDSRSYEAASIRDIFCDAKGYTYLRFESALLQLDRKGAVQWSAAVRPEAGYFMTDGYLISHTFDIKTYTHTYKAYSVDQRGKLSPLTDRKLLYRYTSDGPIDQSGGVYALDDNTNELTDRNWGTGQVKWSFKLSKADRAKGIGLASFTMRSDRAGNVYFSANVGTVYSFDPTGKPRFAVAMSNKTIAYSGIVPVSDKLTVIFNGNHIACIEKIA
ncbi:hypothetical protein [Cohnella sp. 56]|uniref:hypothetical protein n=1 Tax=Cohnella sp. 56 TaxID=3113722 RepID=UPI0030EA0AA1